MRYVCPLLAVTDLERSKAFYRDLLCLDVEEDFGANVTLTGGVSLQTLDSWRDMLQGTQPQLGGAAGELYFETDDLGEFVERATAMGVRFVHPLVEQAWGQRAVRVFDPDGHVLEVGEPLTAVIRRFRAAGLTQEETAARMDVSLAYVCSHDR